jgi:hypothetical protein
MAVINWLGANTSNKSGPEKYAPPNRRAPEKRSDIDQATADAVDGEIHEIIGRLRTEDATTVPTAVTTADNVNELIGRVSGASMEEIDRVIRDLESVRDMLRNEGERVSREIAGYVTLSHAATTAMKDIADSLTQWKSAPDKSRPR